MSISYPTRRVRPVRGTQSTAAGRSRLPVTPANDRYFGSGGSPTARPLLRGGLTPSPFQAPAISYGQPLRYPPPIYLAPDTLSGTRYAGLAPSVTAAAGRLVGALQVINIVDGVVATVLRPVIGAIAPSNGFWRRKHGPHVYAYPYNTGVLGAGYTVYDSGLGYIDKQAVSGFQQGVYDLPGNHVKFGIWERSWLSATRYAQHSVWEKVATAALADNVRPMPAFVPPVNPFGFVPHWLDPLATPVRGAYVHSPTPYSMIPHVGQNPFRAYGVSAGNIAPTPGVGTRPVGAVGANPRGVPPPMVFSFPAVGPVLTPRPVAEPYRPRQPIRGEEVEGKWIGGIKAGSALANGLSAITETLDAVDAIWRALPPSARTGYYDLKWRNPDTGQVETYSKYRHKASAMDKVRDLAQHWNEIDPALAFSNFTEEQAEDFFYGAIGRGAARARNRARFDDNRRANAERAKRGRRYRQTIRRRRGENWIDAGPNGRGYQFGPAL